MMKRPAEYTSGSLATVSTYLAASALIDEANMHIQTLYHRTCSALGWLLTQEIHFVTRQTLKVYASKFS
jgi:hypothetical protein